MDVLQIAKKALPYVSLERGPWHDSEIFQSIKITVIGLFDRGQFLTV